MARTRKRNSRAATMDAKNSLSDKWPTIFDLASQIPQVDLNRVGKHPGGGKNRPPVTHGLAPETFPVKQGYITATPEQLASLRVPVIEVNGDIRGFQREKANAHARKIARALLDGEEMPPINVSIFPDGKAYVGEGQHRALGAIIARKPLEVVVKRRTVEQARKLFANQGKAKKIKSDDTLLSGDSVIELYIQDALTSDGHPWSDLVSANPSSTSKMTPTTMAIIVGAYTYNTLNQGVNFYTSRDPIGFDEKLADQLADLIRVFGNKTTNPLAFRGRTLRAIAYAALLVFRRNPQSQDGDFARWRKHMATFDFGKYPHLLTKETEMAHALIDHWNKRLSADRKVAPLVYSHI